MHHLIEPALASPLAPLIPPESYQPHIIKNQIACRETHQIPHHAPESHLRTAFTQNFNLMHRTLTANRIQRQTDRLSFGQLIHLLHPTTAL